MEERKNVYLSLHKSFVREGIEYTDRATGEARTFNSATLPKGTVVDGVDVGGYEFSPMFVNESRFKGADFRDIPLLANREVWLRKTVKLPDTAVSEIWQVKVGFQTWQWRKNSDEGELEENSWNIC